MWFNDFIFSLKSNVYNLYIHVNLRKPLFGPLVGRSIASCFKGISCFKGVSNYDDDGNDEAREGGFQVRES